MSHGLACDFNTTRMTTEGMLQTEIYFLNLREASFASGFNSVQRLYSKFFIKVKSLHLLLTLFSWSVLCTGTVCYKPSFFWLDLLPN